MLEGVFSSILNSFLSAYVENLNTKQLNVGIWGGDIRLKNLKLKKGALDALHLPVDVVGGSIGSLVLQIPWTQLSSRPVKAYIDDVYLLATMSSENKSTPEEDAKRAHDVKMEKVKRNEIYAMRKGAGASGADDQQQQGYIQALTEKIIDNVQIVVKNVHLRYEDNISVPGHPFAAGFTFAEISLVSTDENWKEAFISGHKKGAHKLAKLDSLALYFDTDSKSLTGLSPEEFNEAFTNLIAREDHLPKHQYILKPVTGEGKTVIRSLPTKELAKIDLQLSFRELGFVLDSNQFRDTVSTAHQLEYNKRQADYLSYRPPDSEFKENRYRALWKFATTAVRHEIHEREYRWTWESMAKRRDDRKQYVSIHKLDKQGLCPASDKPKLDEIERRYSASDIILWRWIARNELKAEQKTAEEQHPQQHQGGGWFGGWFGGGRAKSPDQEASDQLDSDEIVERFGVRGEDVTADIDLPEDAIKFAVNAKLETGSLALRSGDEGTDIIRMVFDAFSADLLKRKENLEVAMGLGGMRVYDATVPGTQYPQVVRIKEESRGPSRVGSLDATQADTTEGLREESDPDHPFFYVKFESKPLDRRADSAVTVKMRPMEIVYHRGYIEKIVWFFSPQDDDKLETVGAMMDVAGGALAENFRQTTRIGLEWALEQHSSIDVRADLNAPIIIIPEDVTKRDSQHLMLDAGHISVSSDLIPQEERVKTKDKKQLTEDDFHYLESIMYDKMHVDLEDTQLIMGSSLDECLSALADEHPEGDLHLLERISMHFDVSRCIVPMAPNLTQLKIAGDLPELHVNFSDRKYRTIMRMKDVAIPNLDRPDETEGEQSKAVNEQAAPATKKEQQPHEAKDVRPGRPSMRRKSVFSRPSALFQENRQGEYTIDESDDEGGKKGDDGEDEFFEAPDVAEAGAKYRRKDLELTFTVGKLMASVFKSRTIDDGEDRHLVDPTLEGFVFSFDKRQYDMTVGISLKTLYLDDKMIEKDSPFTKLMTSESLDEKESSGAELVKFKYVQVEKESPEFMTVHEGVAQTIEVDLSTINVYITRPSILELYDWIMSTFAGGDEKSGDSQPDTPSEGSEAQVQPVQDDTPQKLRVKARLTGIAFVLHEERAKIATLALSAADVSVLLNGPTMRISARLGNLAFDDDSDKPVTSHFRNMLRIEEDELADFQYETFDRRDSTYPGHDCRIWLRSGSLHFTVIDDTLHRLLVFVNQFAKMKAVMDRASEAAKQASKQASEATQQSKMHVDILVNSPVITFPRGGALADCLRAYLGEISLRNEFSGDDDHLVTKYIAGLHNVRLTSDFYRDQKSHTLQVLEDVNFDVVATNFANIDRATNRQAPDNDILAKVTDVKMQLTQAQYQMIMTLATTIPRIFDTSDVVAHVDEAIPEPVAPRPVSSPDSENSSQEQIVDLLPELPVVARTQEGKEVPLWSTMELYCEIPSISLELFDGNEVEKASLAQTRIAQTSINAIRVNYKSLSDGSMSAEVALKSLKARDTRAKAIAHRQVLVGASDGGNQLMLSYTQSGFDGSKMIHADLDSPTLLLSPDYLMAIAHFFSSPPTDEDEESRHRVHGAEEKDGKVEEAQPSPSLSFRFNIVRPKLTILADPGRPDSDAVRFKVDRIIMTQQRTLSIAIARLSASLRAANTELVQFLDDLDFQATLDQNNEQGRQHSAIEAHLTPFVARVSLRDIFALYSIYQTAMSSMTPETPSPDDDKRSLSESASKGDQSPEPERLHVSTQSAHATIDKLQLILISDLHELPVIDLSTRSFSIQAKDWSSDLSLETTISPFINYYNLTNSHWEPLLDPWSFQFRMQRFLTPTCLTIQLSSRQRLDLNITATFVEMALTAWSIWSREGQKILKQNRGGTEPYTIRNRTGYGLLIWAQYDDVSRGDAHELPDGRDTPWRFEDWKATRQNVLTSSHDKLGVAIQGTTWQELSSISVVREGQHVYSLRPKMEGVTHRLLCQVELHDNIKVVTLRSTFSVQNDTSLPVEMVIVDGNGKNIGDVHHIAPGEACPVPIQAAYSERVKIRPNVGFGYGWCKASFHWKDLVKQPVRTIVCPPIQGNGAPHRFVAATVYDKDDPVVRHYPKLTLRLRAPIEVENLLPYDIKFRVYLKERERTYSAFLRKGGVSPLHIVDPLDLLLLGIEIEEDGVVGFKRSDYSIINTDSPEDLPLEYMLPIQDDDGLTLSLRLHYVRYPMSGGAFKVQIYCPYVVINKTGLDFSLQSRTSIGFTKPAAGLNLYSDPQRRRQPAPFLFAHPTNDTGNRALLRVGDSQWCKQPINFDVVGADRQVTMQSPSKTNEITVAIGIAEGLGAYELTKVVTIYPRFVLSNKSKESLWIREARTENAVLMAAGEKTPLTWWHDSKDPQIVIAFDAAYDKRWSKPFRISSVGKLYIRMAAEHSNRVVLAEVLLQGQSLFIRFQADPGYWPFIVRNRSTVPLLFGQPLKTADDERRRRSPGGHAHPMYRSYRSGPGTDMDYAWDDPSVNPNAIRFFLDEPDQPYHDVDILAIGTSNPLTSAADNTQSVVFDVVAEGPTQVVVVTNYTPKPAIAQHRADRRSGGKLQRQSTTDTTDYLGVEEPKELEDTFVVSISLEGIGISVIDQKLRELVYGTLRGIDITMNDNPARTAYGIIVRWIQVDNQLDSSPAFPTLLRPDLEYDPELLELRPNFQAELVPRKDTKHGVQYFEYASTLLQAMYFELDESFIYALVNFAKVAEAMGQDEKLNCLTAEPAETPEPVSEDSGSDLYFDVFELQPVVFIISFERTDDRDTPDRLFDSRNPLSFVANAVTMALGTISNARVEFKSIGLWATRTTSGALVNRVLAAYRAELVPQLYRLVGSADFLGNPVGLFTNVASGVSDLFYEPINGVVAHGGADLGYGIARGAGNFLKKSAFGVTDSVSKLTGTVGKGISAATLDPAWAAKRQQRQMRNRYKINGFATGASAFVDSIASGFSGIATKPIEGAERGGAGGFFKGIGKGVVGVLTKPAVGTFDLLSNVSGGLRNATTVFDAARAGRIRLPRHISHDGVLRPHSARESQGLAWLKTIDNGKYRGSEYRYVAHVELPNDEDHICILTTRYLLLVRINRLSTLWQVSLEDLKSISLEANGIMMTLRGDKPGPFIALSDSSLRIWFFSHIKSVVSEYNDRRNQAVGAADR